MSLLVEEGDIRFKAANEDVAGSAAGAGDDILSDDLNPILSPVLIIVFTYRRGRYQTQSCLRYC